MDPHKVIEASVGVLRREPVHASAACALLTALGLEFLEAALRPELGNEAAAALKVAADRLQEVHGMLADARGYDKSTPIVVDPKAEG